jgi:hypothetical protein
MSYIADGWVGTAVCQPIASEEARVDADCNGELDAADALIILETVAHLRPDPSCSGYPTIPDKGTLPPTEYPPTPTSTFVTSVPTLGAAALPATGGSP